MQSRTNPIPRYVFAALLLVFGLPVLVPLVVGAVVTRGLLTIFDGARRAGRVVSPPAMRLAGASWALRAVGGWGMAPVGTTERGPARRAREPAEAVPPPAATPMGAAQPDGGSAPLGPSRRKASI